MATPLPVEGQIIDGTFRVESRLGSGAAGTAFMVTLTRAWAGRESGTAFCLKWYKDDVFDWEAAPNVVARRVREATIGGSLDHPNLVRVYDTSEFWAGGTPHYLLMDLIRGETLDKLVARGPVESERVHQILLDTASGLKALHDKGLVHRDVKAANVMVGPDGHAVVLDLGVVRPDTEETVTDTRGFLVSVR